MKSKYIFTSHFIHKFTQNIKLVTALFGILFILKVSPQFFSFTLFVELVMTGGEISHYDLVKETVLYLA